MKCQCDISCQADAEYVVLAFNWKAEKGSCRAHLPAQPHPVYGHLRRVQPPQFNAMWSIQHLPTGEDVVMDDEGLLRRTDGHLVQL